MQRAPRHDPHCAWYITSPRRPSQHPRCVRVYWHTLAHHILTLSHTHAQLEQDLQELRRQYVADGFLNLNQGRADSRLSSPSDLLPAAPDVVGASAADDEALGAKGQAPHAEAIVLMMMMMIDGFYL